MSSGWVETRTCRFWLVVWNMAFMTFHSVGKFITPSVTHSIIFQRGRYTNHQPGLAHGSTVLRHFKLAGVNWYGASDSFHVVTGPGSIGANCEPKPSIEFWHGPPTGSKGATNAPRYHVQNEYIEYSLESLDSEFRAAFIVWVINWTVTVSQKCGNHQNSKTKMESRTRDIF